MAKMKHAHEETIGPAQDLAPTAEVPQSKGKDQSPCYAPCPACRAMVLTGNTWAGARLSLDVQGKARYCPDDPHEVTYRVVWKNGARWPRLEETRGEGYPVHGCRSY